MPLILSYLRVTALALSASESYSFPADLTQPLFMLRRTPGGRVCRIRFRVSKVTSLVSQPELTMAAPEKDFEKKIVGSGI